MPGDEHQGRFANQRKSLVVAKYGKCIAIQRGGQLPKLVIQAATEFLLDYLLAKYKLLLTNGLILLDKFQSEAENAFLLANKKRIKGKYLE